MSKPIQDKDLARATLRLLGTDKILLLSGNTSVIEGNIYLYNDRYYKCTKNGEVNSPNEEYFQEINFYEKIPIEKQIETVKKKLSMM